MVEHRRHITNRGLAQPRIFSAKSPSWQPEKVGFDTTCMGHQLRDIGIEQNIMYIYQSICSKWSAGDLLTFCGFSRGAFTARCAANFVAEMGILPLNDTNEAAWLTQAQVAYAKWVGSLKAGPQSPAPPSSQANIDCVAVFDTVSSVGAVRSLGGQPERDPLVLKAANMDSKIKNAFQALALNEGRPDCVPEIWPGPNGGQVMRQTWFVGQHSDIGGGPKVGTANNMLQDAALRWMVALMHDACGIGFAIDNPEVNNMFKVQDVGDLNQGQQNPGGFPTDLPPKSAREPGVAAPLYEAVHVSVRVDGLLNLAVKPTLLDILGQVSPAPPFQWTRTVSGREIRLREDQTIALIRQPGEKNRTARGPVHPIPSVSNRNPRQVLQPTPRATVGGIQGTIPTGAP